MSVSRKDREMLRTLAAQVAEIAALPEQQKTIALHKALNGLKPVRPMVMIDQVCWHEMNVKKELTLRGSTRPIIQERCEASVRAAALGW